MSFSMKARIHMSNVNLDFDANKCLYWVSTKDKEILPSIKFYQPIRSCELARVAMQVDMAPRKQNLILPRAQMYFGTQ